jgi:hypothetical protein
MNDAFAKKPPQLTDDDLVKVAGAQNQAEAEFVQGLLLEEGFQSVLRRTAGADVPEFLAAGPRDVLVPASRAELARDALLQANHGQLVAKSGGIDSPLRLLAGVLIAAGLVALIVWLGTELLG